MAGFAGGLAQEARAVTTILWGSEAFASLKNSKGIMLDPGTYTFQLGTFWDTTANVAFVPTWENASAWEANWKVFDTASYDPFYSPILNQTFGQFAGKAVMDSDGFSDGVGATANFDFSDKAAYLWVYNQTTFERSVVEWFLGRDASWVFPTKSTECCPSSMPVEWSLSDLTSTVGDTPVWGGQEGTTGAGFQEVSGNFDLQTFSAVPELSAVPAMMAVALVLGCHRERRRSTKRVAADAVA